jgi:hypothetical protein
MATMIHNTRTNCESNTHTHTHRSRARERERERQREEREREREREREEVNGPLLGKRAVLDSSLIEGRRGYLVQRRGIPLGGGP